MEKHVGVIGVGRMGHLMVEYLIKNQYQVTAYDVFAPAVERAVSLGAKAAKTVEEVAKTCDLILLSLPKPQHVRETVEKIASAINSGTVIADTSTVNPETSRSNADLLKGTGAYYVDAPILGLPTVVGSWIMPLGGEPAAISRLEPVLLCFATKVVRVGDVGCGNAIKLLNNTMFAVINAISAEMMHVADKVGVDKNVFYNTVANSKAATVSGLFKEVGKRICEDRYDEPTFTLDLLYKDVNLGVQMARSAGINPLVASSVLEINENACHTGFGNQDCSGIYNYMARLYKA